LEVPVEEEEQQLKTHLRSAAGKAQLGNGPARIDDDGPVARTSGPCPYKKSSPKAVVSREVMRKKGAVLGDEGR